MDETPLEPRAQQPATRPPATFTREELDAAEPERHPSVRRRWLVGFVIGALGGWLALIGSALSLIALAALPFALTPAGAGILLGAGIMQALAFGMLSDQVLGADPAPLALVFWGLGAVVLAAGVAGTVVIARRERTRAR